MEKTEYILVDDYSGIVEAIIDGGWNLIEGNALALEGFVYGEWPYSVLSRNGENVSDRLYM